MDLFRLEHIFIIIGYEAGNSELILHNTGRDMNKEEQLIRHYYTTYSASRRVERADVAVCALEFLSLATFGNTWERLSEAQRAYSCMDSNPRLAMRLILCFEYLMVRLTVWAGFRL